MVIILQRAMTKKIVSFLKEKIVMTDTISDTNPSDSTGSFSEI